MSSKQRPGATAQAARTFSYPRMPNAAPGAAEQILPEGRFVADARSDEERDKQLWKKAFEEGRASVQAEHQKSLAAARAGIGKAVAAFAAERQSYFDRVEKEVVQLSLSIARKITRREAQMDPLVLAGVVRVALEKIGAESGVRMRVHPAEIEHWRSYFHLNAEKGPVPELVGDPQLEPFHCLLETSQGSCEIGIEAQLKEIEQGFADLLAQRPGAR